MKKRIVFGALLIGTILIAASLSFAQGAPGLSRSEVAKAIADKMCIKTVPPMETIPADQQYEITANALAARGINNFVGKDAAEIFTTGEIKEIYYVVTAAQQTPPSEQKAECPLSLTACFNLPAETKLTQGDLSKILDCFPACNLTAEPFTAVVTPPVPQTPETTPEEPASEIQ